MTHLSKVPLAAFGDLSTTEIDYKDFIRILVGLVLVSEFTVDKCINSSL